MSTANWNPWPSSRSDFSQLQMLDLSIDFPMKMAIEIVDLPIENAGSFHSFSIVYHFGYLDGTS